MKILTRPRGIDTELYSSSSSSRLLLFSSFFPFDIFGCRLINRRIPPRERERAPTNDDDFTTHLADILMGLFYYYLFIFSSKMIVIIFFFLIFFALILLLLCSFERNVTNIGQCGWPNLFIPKILTRGQYGWNWTIETGKTPVEFLPSERAFAECVWLVVVVVPPGWSSDGRTSSCLCVSVLHYETRPILLPTGNELCVGCALSHLTAAFRPWAITHGSGWISLFEMWNVVVCWLFFILCQVPI